MDFSTDRPYYCGVCGRDGPGWRFVGIEELGDRSRWIMALCPKCGSTRYVQRVENG